MLDIASGDGVLAELLAPHAHRYVCIDSSQRVVAAAGERLRRFPNVEVRGGDMHALPFKDGSFDLVVLMHALTYAERPAQAVAEAAQVLRKGGRLLLSSLARHEHPAWSRPTATATSGSARRTCASSRKGRAEDRQLRHGDPREAAAALRGDLADRR